MNREMVEGERDGIWREKEETGRERGEIGIWVECRNGEDEREDRDM